MNCNFYRSLSLKAQIPRDLITDEMQENETEKTYGSIEQDDLKPHFCGNLPA